MTPPDYTWITLTGSVLQALIPTVATAIAAVIIAVRVKKVEGHAIEAKVEAVAAKDQAVETAKAVNGRMEGMLELTASKATAEATLAEQQAEAERRRVATLLIPERRIAPDGVSALTKLEEAKEEAHKVLALAAETAKKLIDDATHPTKEV